MPLTLAAPVHSELIIKKSRVIGGVEPLADRAGAPRGGAGRGARPPGAPHRGGGGGGGGQSAAVDDGEPSGTAGRPMLDVLRHQDLEGVLATVVRYFGGVKLGAGGLVRAYTDAVAQALLQAEKVPIVRLQTLACVVPYALEGLLRRELDAAGANLMRVAHGQAVELHFNLPEEAAAALQARLAEAGQGRLAWLDEAGG